MNGMVREVNVYDEMLKYTNVFFFNFFLYSFFHILQFSVNRGCVQERDLGHFVFGFTSSKSHWLLSLFIASKLQRKLLINISKLLCKKSLHDTKYIFHDQ